MYYRDPHSVLNKKTQYFYLFDKQTLSFRFLSLDYGILHSRPDMISTSFYYPSDAKTSTTVSWGSTFWRDRFDSSGIKYSKEEIVEVARQHNSCDCMTLPGDYRNVYSIDDFLKMDLT